MKTIFQHIEHIKGKPHHIRKRVAFMAAASVSILIALVWLIGSLSLGAFALKGSNFAESTGAATAAGTNTSANNGLAGAAAVQGPNTPAHIEIIDTSVSVPKKPAERTVIPF